MNQFTHAHEDLVITMEEASNPEFGWLLHEIRDYPEVWYRKTRAGDWSFYTGENRPNAREEGPKLYDFRSWTEEEMLEDIEKTYQNIKAARPDLESVSIVSKLQAPEIQGGYTRWSLASLQAEIRARNQDGRSRRDFLHQSKTVGGVKQDPKTFMISELERDDAEDDIAYQNAVADQQALQQEQEPALQQQEQELDTRLPFIRIPPTCFEGTLLSSLLPEHVLNINIYYHFHPSRFCSPKASESSPIVVTDQPSPVTSIAAHRLATSGDPPSLGAASGASGGVVRAFNSSRGPARAAPYHSSGSALGTVPYSSAFGAAPSYSYPSFGAVPYSSALGVAPYPYSYSRGPTVVTPREVNPTTINVGASGSYTQAVPYLQPLLPRTITQNNPVNNIQITRLNPQNFG